MIIKLYEKTGNKSKEEILREVVDLMVKNKICSKEYYDGVLLREKQAPFYIGNYISIPHAILDYSKYIVNNGIVVLRFKKAIDWDGNKVHYVIGIAAKGEEHMNVLMNIGGSFCDEQSTIDSLNIELDKLVDSLGWN